MTSVYVIFGGVTVLLYCLNFLALIGWLFLFVIGCVLLSSHCLFTFYWLSFFLILIGWLFLSVIGSFILLLIGPFLFFLIGSSLLIGLVFFFHIGSLLLIGPFFFFPIDPLLLIGLLFHCVFLTFFLAYHQPVFLACYWLIFMHLIIWLFLFHIGQCLVLIS